MNAQSGAGKRVLVIDDEESIFEMIRGLLAESGYQVDVASDGESGLRRITQQRYDLALCDWKMPGLNGQQVYEHVRAVNPALSERMIFITGDVISEKVQTFLTKQKRVCLSKPFSIAQLKAALDRAVGSG